MNTIGQAVFWFSCGAMFAAGTVAYLISMLIRRAVRNSKKWGGWY